MGFEKAELRAQIMTEVGADVEDAHDGAKEERAGLAGAKRALVSASSMIEQLIQVAQKEVEEEKLDEASYAIVKRYVLRSAEVVRNMAVNAEVQMHMAQGKVQALEAQMKVIQKKRESEMERAKALAQAAEQQNEVDAEREGKLSRLPGQHPGPPIKAQRDPDVVIHTTNRQQVEPMETTITTEERPASTPKKAPRNKKR